MRTFTLLLTLLISSQFIAQNSKLTFFTEDGQRFYVILNGLRYNDNPQTNVQVENLQPQAYKAKIIFEDQTLGEANKNLLVDPGQAYTFNIRERKENAVATWARQAKSEVKNEFDGDNIDQDYSDPKEKYVIRFMGQVALQQAPPPRQPAAQQPAPANPATAYPSASQTTTTTTTTTSSSSNAQPANSGSVSMNINISASDNGQSGNAGISMNATEHYQESSNTTVTTTTTQGSGAPAADHYVMPGYNGPYGCPWPMTPEDFAAAKGTISSKTWDETRISIAKQVTQANCLFADQVKEIADLMEWEETKLDYAKFAYPYTYDQGNYFKVHNTFEWETSIEELNRAIGH